MAEQAEQNGDKSNYAIGSSGANLASEHLEIVAVNPEQAEAQRPPRLQLSFDREKIATSELPEEMKDWLMRLPENLNFTDPVTLIVGDNGTGKTSIARGIVAALSRARMAANPEGRFNDLYLENGEPANAIADAINVSVEDAAKGNIITTFIEGSEVMFKSREWAREQARSQGRPNSTEVATWMKGHTTEEEIVARTPIHELSSRQLFEQSIQGIKRQSIDSHRQRVGGDVVVIFDEPEQGLSPQRQLELPGVIAGFLDEHDTMLVPTNNLALYLSDMPRIDVDHPDRGVYKPSDYDEGGKIELFHSEGQE